MNRNSEVARAVTRALAMGAAASAAAYTAPAAAQTSQTAEEPTQTVVVTGSRIRRVDEETASPVYVLDQTAIASSGVANMGELVQRIPSIAGAATNPQVNNGGGTGESNVELRGLGAQRTLVLLNGRRIGILSNTTTSAVDINMIPLNAIERVEVLKEGAGAVYGSDAIAGVVNFITRTNVDGAEASVDYGETSHSDGEHYSTGLLFGTSTDKMTFMLAANYNKQKAVSAGDRDFSKFALYLYGGVPTAGGSSRTPNGRITLPDNLAATFGCSSVTRKEGAVGTALGDYRCYDSATDAYNYQPLNLLMTPQERGSLFSQVNYDINDYLSIYGEALYTHTSSGFQIAPLPFDARADDTIISADNYYNPFGSSFGGVAGDFPNFLTRMTALGTRRSEVSTQDSLMNTGLKGKIADTGWEWDLNLGYGRKEQEQNIYGYLLSNAMDAAVGPSFLDTDGVVKCGTPGNVVSGCTPLNIFNPTDPSQVAALTGVSSNYRNNYTYRSHNAALNVTGSLFELPAGAVQLAVGGEYRDQEGDFTVDILTRAQPPLFLTCQLAGETCSGDSHAKYNVRELYAEIFAPLLADKPGVKALNINAGIRWSDYSKSTIGSSTNAEFKIEYRPISDVLIRGTYAEVFRAPTIVDLSLPFTQDAPTFSDPCTALTPAKVAATPNLALACKGVPLDGTFVQPQSQITGLITGSQDLKPEEGDVTTAGIVYDVSQVGGLSFSLDYWRYKLNDLITNLDPNFAVNQCVLTGNPDFCDLMVRYDATSPNAGEFQVFREPIVNLGKLKTDGFDFGVKYAIRDTPVGSFNTTLDITRINSYENTPAPGADPIEIAGTFDRQFGNYAKYRGNLGVGWNMFGVDALLTVRYIHNIELKEADGCLPNCPGGATDPNPTVSIPSFTYFDLTVGYTLPTKTRIQAGVINLGDKDPPILYQNNVLNANTDVSTYDTLGRRWFVGVTQKF